MTMTSLLFVCLLFTTNAFRFHKALYNIKKNSLMNFIERIYKNSDVFPGSTLIQYPKQLELFNTDNTTRLSKWYTIGKSKDFYFGSSTKITIEDQNYIVWRKEVDEFVGLSDTCSHGGGSLSEGRMCGNNIECPRHYNKYNEDGEFINRDGSHIENAQLYDITKHNVVEHNDWVYFNKNYYDNSTVSLPHSINFEGSYSINHVEEIFNCNHETVLINALDLIHSIFTDFFGNVRDDNIQLEKPVELGLNHYKLEYHYNSDTYSLANYAFGVNNITIHNEYLFPYTTVSTINMGNKQVVIVASVLPISKNKTKLFIKCYRNFWFSSMGDAIITQLMSNIMKQHSNITNAISGTFTIEELKQTYRNLYEEIHSKM